MHSTISNYRGELEVESTTSGQSRNGGRLWMNPRFVGSCHCGPWSSAPSMQRPPEFRVAPVVRAGLLHW